MVRQGKILGHIVSKNGISTNEEKVSAIAQMAKPTNAKQVQGLMGHRGHYHRFIYNYATIAKPLYTLLVNFEWREKCDKAFEKLKNALVNARILRISDWNKPFHVHIDASKFAVGCVLAQPGENKLGHPMYFASR